MFSTLYEMRICCLVCSILVAMCTAHSNYENEYPHFTFLTTNNKVIGSLKSAMVSELRSITFLHVIDNSYFEIE